MTFDPIHLAISLPKGYAKEYRDRNWFDQIYFSKLAMAQELEGYTPILYDFELVADNGNTDNLPEKLLMTFYYPEQRRISKLNGIIIIGGQPDIYQAYRVTQLLTPQLESLIIEKHDIPLNYNINMIDETLQLLSSPQRVRSTLDILERSTGKSGDALTTFYPILSDLGYQQERLLLPYDFKLDIVFLFKIEPTFFTSNQLGAGITSLRMFKHKQSSFDKPPYLAFPLIFKWQPLYNDILVQLKTKSHILPHDFEGKLIPRIVIFHQENTNSYTALFSAVHELDGQWYYHVALARSGADEGQPLSLLVSALSREKFGASSWLERLDKRRKIPQESIRDHDRSIDDLISPSLVEIVQDTDLTIDGKFDVGVLRSIRVEEIK